MQPVRNLFALGTCSVWHCQLLADHFLHNSIHSYLVRRHLQTKESRRHIFQGGLLHQTMGLLSEGSPLSWEDTKKYADHVRKHGIQQFLNLYRKLQSRTKDVLYWGDEVSVFQFLSARESGLTVITQRFCNLQDERQHLCWRRWILCDPNVAPVHCKNIHNIRRLVFRHF